MRVRATKPGYYNGLHLPDTDSAEFEVAEGTAGSWFVAVDAAPAAKAPAPAAKAPKGKSHKADPVDSGEGMV